MYWADKIAKEIIDSGSYLPYWVDDMKTPSGRVHVGSLRGVVVHDLVHRALKDAGKEVKFTYVIEDHDPVDDIPTYLDRAKWEKYLGQPLFSVPAPSGKTANYAAYFALEFQQAFNKIGCHPELIWMNEIYRSGKMNAAIKTCLDNAEEIRKIYEELYEKKMSNNWYPFLALCPRCGKQSTTKVTDWDGNKITFSCAPDAVTWTKGCGYSGKASPFSGDGVYRGKMPWKVEWPAKWMVIGVTIEGAGKDHMSAGGSHDFAKLICERVLKYQVPYAVPYEFFLVGGRKMSSSKGRGTSAKEVSEILPPYLLRFLMSRTDKDQAIDFDPIGWTIPNLFDEYDRAWQAYIDDSDADLARAFVLSQIEDTLPKKTTFLPRFRSVANYLELPNIDLVERFAQEKGSSLTDFEKEILMERISFAKVWLEKFAPDEYRYHLSEIEVGSLTLTVQQKDFLRSLAPIWEGALDPEKLQADVFNLIKSQNINSKDAFKALYRVILDKDYGPRAGWLLKKFPKEKIISRLKLGKVNTTSKEQNLFKLINQPNLFTIDKEVKEKYPSVTVGIAIIKGVQISKHNEELQKEIAAFLDSIVGLTTEQISQYPEIQSYRKIYKETGIDWHSRRPSPEALLRRVVLGKGLYSINTCVDAYNLVVMRNRVSSGAFNFDEIKFPTVLRFAKSGETIHLLGDETTTEYKAGEIAYFDQTGGFNMDFNYRDSKRTKVDESTKNLWINIEGVYSISRSQVEKTLQETIDMILKYCGGQVELSGIIFAK